LTTEASIWPIRLPARWMMRVGRGVAAAAGLADVDGVELAVARRHSASAGLSPASPPHGHARDRRAGRHRLDAAEVAAMAARAFLVDADVADVAGRAVGAAVHLAVADDAAADAGADLDDEEVGQRTLQPPQLAQRHQVDVVVDEHRRGVVLAQVVADREAVPGRHQRRVHELADGEVDRPGHADADADHVPWRDRPQRASSSRMRVRTRASTTPGLRARRRARRAARAR
jgi:hypothetical protein